MVWIERSWRLDQRATTVESQAPRWARDSISREIRSSSASRARPGVDSRSVKKADDNQRMQNMPKFWRVVVRPSRCLVSWYVMRSWRCWLELVLAVDWNGAKARTDERVTVILELDSDFLCVRVRATHFADPLPAGPVGPTWRLWEYEVVEVFIAGQGDPAPYLEVELGPAGHYLVLWLEGRRNVVRHSLIFEYNASISAGVWSGCARIPWAWLPPGPHTLNAYCIHGVGPARRHLAWSPVPGEAPDFHRLECFRAVDLQEGLED
ncbi:MAG: hypothetical protein ACI9MC_000028 [Kiritimatiellia bacterium]|jgi:hypothetical protein